MLEPSTPRRIATAALLALCALMMVSAPALAAGSQDGGPIPWHADAYEAALAEARATNRPLVIDLWAEWCHTCLSMKHTVLRDPHLAAVADRFVWLAMDTDRAVNAAALAKFPPEVWPTFFVVDARDESVAARLLGAASPEAFVAFLDAGARRVAGRESPAEEAARVGDMASAGGRYPAAADAFARAVKAAPGDWPRGPAVRVAWLNALYRAGAHRRCVDVGRAELKAATRGHTPAAADFVYYLHGCAVARARAGAPLDGALLDTAIAAVQAAVDDPAAPLTVDDRSEARRILREIHMTRGRPEAARTQAEAQRALLDRAAAQATPYAAMTWHWPRAEVYAFLGEPAELIPALKASMKALPDAYEPPYRLAWIQLKANQPDAARASARAAIERVYGPRAARAWTLLADIEVARGDRVAARAALAEAVAVWKALPEGQRRASARAAAEKRLADFDAETARETQR